MNDQELADAIVTMGVSKCLHTKFPPSGYVYTIPNTAEAEESAHDFVRDPRVAIAMTEKLYHSMSISIKTIDSAAFVEVIEYGPNGDEEAKPIRTVAHEQDTSYAINKACVEALNG